jgi:hypothetical protein
VGIEYPYLAILATIAFVAAIMGVMYFFIHTYTEILKTPVLSTYAEACYTESNAYLNITLKHERGVPVSLQRIEVYSDRGTVVYTPGASLSGISVRLEGFDGRLGAGQVGVVKMTFPQGYFTEGKTYHGLAFFDAGNTIFTFQLTKCPSIAPAPPPLFKAKLLNMNMTAGNGTVTALGTITLIELKARNARYFDTFDSDPFTAGRLSAVTCRWSYDPVNKNVYINVTSRPATYGDECIALANTALPGNGTIYVASLTKIVSGEGYADIVLVQNSSSLYTLGLYIGKDIVKCSYEIWKYYVGKWDSLNAIKNGTLNYNITYSIVAAYTFSSGDLRLWSDKTLRVSARDTTVIPLRAGVGVYISVTSNKQASASRGVFVIFDNVVVAVNARPWFVNVTLVDASGAPISGWSVVLKDSVGRVISNATSVGGVASLDVWGYFIVPGGVIEVYDDRGVLVGAKRFDFVVGGDVYVARVDVRRVEFTGLLVGIGGSTKILVYNISGGVEGIALRYVIDSGTVFNGRADIAIGSGTIYMLNASGVYEYRFMQGAWALTTASCKATGIGARLEVVNNTLVAIPGTGNNTLCLYKAGKAVLQPIAKGSVTAYTSTASMGADLYISLYDASLRQPIIAVYSITDTSATIKTTYSITGYKLTGLACDTTGNTYFIHEYGGLYTLDINTKSVNPLQIVLPFTPRGYGDRLEYYNNHLIFARGDDTTELYIIPLST